MKNVQHDLQIFSYCKKEKSTKQGQAVPDKNFLKRLL